MTRKKSKLKTKKLKPLTFEEFYKRQACSHKDIKSGKLIAHNSLKKKYSSSLKVWNKNLIKERIADYKQNSKQVEDFDNMISDIEKDL